MDENLQNIEESFRQAFDKWEPDHSMQEMQQSWQHVAKHIPHAPVPHHVPGGKALGWGAGKILGITGIGAVVATTAVVLYNNSTHKSADAGKPAVQTTVQVQPKPDALANGNSTVPAQTNNESPATKTRTSGIIIKQPKAGSNPSAQKQSPSHTGGTTSPGIVTGVLGTIIPSQQVNANKAPVNSNANQVNSASASSSPAGNALNKTYILSDSMLCIGEPLSIMLPGKQGAADWGDGTIGNVYQNTKHIYTRPGRYNVKVFTGMKLLSQTVEVVQKPAAAFAGLDCSGRKFKFRNQTKGAERYIWDFGDGAGVEGSQQAEHQYADTGKYLVKLIAMNSEGCSDTTSRYIDVKNYEAPVVPNAITPDGDGNDDELAVRISNETYYHFVIADMKGRTVFESTDKNQHWNGSINNSGESLPEGSYYYTLQYKFGNEADVQKKSGIIHLMR
jgi:gliding motility-associated-like protein